MTEVYILQSDSGDFEGAFPSREAAAEHAQDLIMQNYHSDISIYDWNDYFAVWKVKYFE
jgi:hypothetical protein